MEASVITAPVAPGRILGAGPLLRLGTDDQLVALFRAGYDEAFEAIDTRYRTRLFTYTRRMLGGSRADAEDATQDVFMSAYRALRYDDRPVSLRAWLYRIAHNRCIDQVRRPVPAPGDVFDASRAPLRDPVVEAERRESVRRVIADMQRLPEQQRSALLMRAIDGLTYAEIATALGVTVAAVKSLIMRARVGLASIDEARNAACADIRADLASAHDRGVRTTGRSCRHLRECAGCREYRTRLRTLERTLGGRAPGHGAFAAIAQLLGIGGAGSGAAVGGTVAVGGPIAAKITALVCCGAVAVAVSEPKAHPTRSPAPHAAHANRTAVRPPLESNAAVRQHVDRGIPPAATRAPARHAPHRAAASPRPSQPLRERPLATRRVIGTVRMTPHEAARQTGGALAPDSAAPAPKDMTLRETPARAPKPAPAPTATPPAPTATPPAPTADPVAAAQPAPADPTAPSAPAPDVSSSGGVTG